MSIRKKNDRFALMLKRTFTSFSLICLLIPVYAQKGFKIGPSVHYISSRASVIDSLPDNYNFRYKSGLGGGIAMQYGFTDAFTLGSGIAYSNKGYRMFNDSNRVDNLLKRNAGHLEVPVNAIFRFGRNRSSKIRILAGITASYMFNSSTKVLENKNRTFNIKEEVKTVFYPLANLGIEIASENKSGNVFVFGAYYKHAFTRQSRLGVYNSDLSSAERFAVAFNGSYLSVGFSFLFDVKNFKRDEVFFY